MNAIHSQGRMPPRNQYTKCKHFVATLQRLTNSSTETKEDPRKEHISKINLIMSFWLYIRLLRIEYRFFIDWRSELSASHCVWTSFDKFAEGTIIY